MFVADVKWRKEFGTDTILQDFHFHERDAFISVYPQGYHKTDKMVPVLVALHFLFANDMHIGADPPLGNTIVDSIGQGQGLADSAPCCPGSCLFLNRPLPVPEFVHQSSTQQLIAYLSECTGSKL